jgi:glutathione S-transferase
MIVGFAASQVTCSRGSPKRQELLDKRGYFQVPYLEDPNTGVYLFESKDIIEYLEKTYALSSSS